MQFCTRAFRCAASQREPKRLVHTTEGDSITIIIVRAEAEKRLHSCSSSDRSARRHALMNKFANAYEHRLATARPQF